jgi:hypothetical protein
MGLNGKSKKPLFFLAFIPILIAGVVFFVRPPVLLVTDSVYEQLYGRFRGIRAMAETSLMFFRLVKPVRIAVDAGIDVAVFTVEAASKKPFCVIFPYRYHREAGQYKKDFPDVPVIILSGRLRELPEDAGIHTFRTGTEGDYFRIGRIAAAFALNRQEDAGGNAGGVLFFRDDLVTTEDWDAFKLGLKAEGFVAEPIEARNTADYTVYKGAACAVISGAAENFLSQDLNLPVIIFSWMDSALTNSMVKVIFDDSPWAQSVAAVKAAAGKLRAEERVEEIPSKILVLKERIPEKEFLRKIMGIVRMAGRNL